MKPFVKTACLSLALVLLFSVIISCAPAAPSSPASPAAQGSVSKTDAAQYPVRGPISRFKIATTTSLYDTGLWGYLEPIFEKKASVEMDIVYAGTGIALEYGRRGDVDALVVHDPAAEDKFIAEGYGINRRYFAYNYFIIAGPSGDPAGVRGLTPEAAFQKICEAGKADPARVKFISRGDNSGTHSKEKLIWQAAGYKYEDIQKSGPWYVEAGKGMGPCLLMANEQGAYVLADISTTLSYKGKLTLITLVDKGDLFLNVYAVMAINPARITTAKMLPTANTFINWLMSDEVQDIIGKYGVTEYGRSLFYPLKGGGCQEKGCPKLEDYTEPIK